MKIQTTTDSWMIREARRIARRKRKSWKTVHSGEVGCVLVTKAGNVYRGISIDAACGIGFCAEHSAIAAMVTAGESRIDRIVAVCSDGRILPPCGRCREFIHQVDPGNKDTVVITGRGRKANLKALLPDRWQDRF